MISLCLKSGHFKISEVILSVSYIYLICDYVVLLSGNYICIIIIIIIIIIVIITIIVGL